MLSDKPNDLHTSSRSYYSLLYFHTISHPNQQQAYIIELKYEQEQYPFIKVY